MSSCWTGTFVSAVSFILAIQPLGADEEAEAQQAEEHPRLKISLLSLPTWHVSLAYFCRTPSADCPRIGMLSVTELGTDGERCEEGGASRSAAVVQKVLVHLP